MGVSKLQGLWVTCNPHKCNREMWVSGNTYSHLSNKRGAHAYQFWKIPSSSKKDPPSSFIDFITKVSDIIAEPDDNFSHDHFEL